MAQHEQLFTVEIISYASERYEEAVAFLVSNFKIDESKAAALLQRLPKVVTKPVPEAQANRVIQRLSTVDIGARVIPQPTLDTIPSEHINSVESEQHKNIASIPAIDSPSMKQGDVISQNQHVNADVQLEETLLSQSLDNDINHVQSAFVESSSQPSQGWDALDKLDNMEVVPRNEPIAFSGPPQDSSLSFVDSKQEGAGSIKFSGPPQVGSQDMDGASEGITFSGPPTGDVSAEALKESSGTGFHSSQPKRRGSILMKLLLSIILPSLISIVGVVWGVFFLVSPALREQLFASARQPAEATVRNLLEPLRESSVTFPGSEPDLRDYDRLQAVQEALAASRSFASGQNILFMVAVDNQGEFVSGWFDDPERITNTALDTLFTDLASQFSSLRGDELQASFKDDQGNTIDILGRSLDGPRRSLGGLLVGIDAASRQQQVNRILLRTLLFLLIPLLIGIVLGIWQGRNVTRNIRLLAGAADDLSRGNLDADIRVRSNDEIAELADAFERLRISLRVAFERMRRK